MEVQKPEVEGKETASEWAWNRPDPKHQMSEELTREALFGNAFIWWPVVWKRGPLVQTRQWRG
jgi:hypothetical protein